MSSLAMDVQLYVDPSRVSNLDGGLTYANAPVCRQMVVEVQVRDTIALRRVTPRTHDVDYLRRKLESRPQNRLEGGDPGCGAALVLRDSPTPDDLALQTELFTIKDLSDERFFHRARRPRHSIVEPEDSSS